MLLVKNTVCTGCNIWNICVLISNVGCTDLVNALNLEQSFVMVVSRRQCFVMVVSQRSHCLGHGSRRGKPFTCEGNIKCITRWSNAQITLALRRPIRIRSGSYKILLMNNMTWNNTHALTFFVRKILNTTH